MRWTSVMSAVMMGHAVALPAQLVTSGDSAGIARALVVYALVHPIGAGGSHGAMMGFAIDSAASRWDTFTARALRQEAPARWLDPSSVQARTQPHLRVQNVTWGGDSVVVETVWTWCFPNDGGESGWPVTYVLDRHAADWSVATAQVLLVGHGRQCSFRRAGAR
jgi:hypothetical protein